MIRAEPKELNREVVPVIEAHLSENQVSRLVPVEMVQLDALAEAEPSLGALLRLETGQYAVVVYGTETQTLSLRLPEDEVSRKAIETALTEIRIPAAAISWRREPDLTRVTAGARSGRYRARVSGHRSEAVRSRKPKKPAKRTTTTTSTGVGGSESGFEKGEMLGGAVAAAATAAGVAYFRATKGDAPGGRKVYHVSPNEEGWQVKGQGAERAVSVHSTKKEALTAARELAHDQVPSQVVVHKSDGTIQRSWSYGPDAE
jgi:hypothetical protein